MLIKKIYIMKGSDSVKSVLKVTLLEKGYTEIELTTHYAYGDNYVFILKAGAFVHVETFDGKKLKRKLSPFNIDDLSAGVCYNGKILSWTAQTPSVPYCLTELAEKYSVIKVESAAEKNRMDEIAKPKADEIINEPAPVIDERIEKVETEETIIDVEPTKKTDITNDFDILEVENRDESTETDGRSLVREIEGKYATYPHNEKLEKIFPDSKWITEDDADSSIGLLYNSTGITHICYAKYSVDDEPFDKSASYYDGYWIVFEEI